MYRVPLIYVLCAKNLSVKAWVLDVDPRQGSMCVRSLPSKCMFFWS